MKSCYFTELYSIMVTRAHEKLKVMSETQSIDAGRYLANFSKIKCRLVSLPFFLVTGISVGSTILARKHV